MTTEQQRLETGIAALEAQRAELGDAVVDAAVSALRARLAELSAAEPGQVRRQVSVLFLDIVGSTQLSRQLDAEDAHDVLDSALTRATRIVEDHSGKVLKYAGDGLLAVFGADVAREDDAVRAVQAGLALLAEARHQRELVRERHGSDTFDMRVGIHTGSVLLGGGLEAASSISGTTVSVAARMEQTAPPGTLRISHETYRHVRGSFDAEAQPPLAVKGIDQPLATYLVRGERPKLLRKPARGVEGVRPRMIGRDRELSQLKEAYAAASKGKAVVATVLGEAGLGKTRLLEEFRGWVERQPARSIVLQGGADPMARGQPYGLLRDTLFAWLSIPDTDRGARGRFEAATEPLLAGTDGVHAAQAQAHLLGQLLGLDFSDSPHVKGIANDGAQIRHRAFHAAASMLRRAALRLAAPILFLQDDLQFADDGTLDFLETLAGVDRDVPLMIAAFARPSLLERRTAWARDAAVHRRIELAPLGANASDSLMIDLLQKLPVVPDSLRAMLAATAEGNPFFMEELVNMLVDDGTIDARGATWRLEADEVTSLRLPQTLAGVVEARLDSLPGEERRVLQRASVIGVVFWDRALAAIDADAPGVLPSLAHRGLVVERPDTAFAGAREFAFKHQILHQATYETVLKRERRDAHARIAEWLAARCGDGGPRWLAATAEHYERAGNVDRAVEYLARAAEDAATRFDFGALCDHVGRSLELAGEKLDPRARWRLLYLRQSAYDRMGRRDEQSRDIEAMDALAERLDDDSCRGETALARCELAFRLRDWAQQAAASRCAMECANRTGDLAMQLRAKRRLAGALVNLGDGDAGRVLIEEGLAQARALGLRQLEGLFVNSLAMLIRETDLIGFLGLVEQDLAISRELGNRADEVVALQNLSTGRVQVGDLCRARQDLAEALRASRAIGYHQMAPSILCNLASVAYNEGDTAAALSHARAAVELALGVRDPLVQAAACYNVGRAELAQGEAARAFEAFTEARSLWADLKASLEYEALAGLARAVLALGDAAGALQHAERLLTHLGSVEPATHGRHLAQFVAAYEVLAHVGDPREERVAGEMYRALMSRADTIGQADLRESFLTNIVTHRQIVSLWQARTQPASQ